MFQCRNFRKYRNYVDHIIAGNRPEIPGYKRDTNQGREV